MLLFRLAAATRALPHPLWLLGLPILLGYRVGVEWILGVELRYKTSIGPGLRLFHGQGLVVHEGTVIGADCTLRHNTTIGNKSAGRAECPVLGDSVEVGSNTVILGGIRIGDRAVIGAGSVVVKDVPPGATVAGNPAREIRKAQS